MYLLTEAEVSTVLTNNVQQGTVTGAPSVNRYAGVLALVTTKVEELLEIETLSMATFTDHFRVAGRGETQLRLSGGFLLQDEPVTILSERDHDVRLPEIDYRLGTITANLVPGNYAVTYMQGFETDPRTQVFEDLPEFLKSIAKYAAISHYRLTTMVSSTPENVSFGDLHPQTTKEMYSRVVKRYVKPRAGVVFPYRTVQHDD